MSPSNDNKSNEQLGDEAVALANRMEALCAGSDATVVMAAFSMMIGAFFSDLATLQKGLNVLARSAKLYFRTLQKDRGVQ